MAARIHELRQQYSDLVAKANGELVKAQAKAKAENRQLSAEETAADDAFNTQIAALENDIKLEERANERAKARQHRGARGHPARASSVSRSGPKPIRPRASRRRPSTCCRSSRTPGFARRRTSRTSGSAASRSWTTTRSPRTRASSCSCCRARSRRAASRPQSGQTNRASTRTVTAGSRSSQPSRQDSCRWISRAIRRAAERSRSR
jgi:hypothetical protein